MAINFLGLPQHFENTEQLREAERQGLISEPQYKTMSGYDASKNIWGLGDLMGPLQPAANVATSGIYNIGKSIFTPQDYFDPKTYQTKMGPLESIGYNVEGALLGLNPELKEKYEGILDLDLRSLTDAWAPEDLTDFSGVYDDDEKGTIAFDPNNPQVKRAGFFDFNPWQYAASKVFQYALKKKREKEKFIKDLEKFQKREQEENRRRLEKQEAEKRQAQLQAQVTQQAYQEAERRVAGGEGRDYGHTETRSSSGWESSPFYEGGRVNFSEGGIVGLWRELSNL